MENGFVKRETFSKEHEEGHSQSLSITWIKQWEMRELRAVFKVGIKKRMARKEQNLEERVGSSFFNSDLFGQFEC